MKILFHYDAGDQLQQNVARLAENDLNVVCCPEGFDEPFNTYLQDAEIIWHVLQPITADMIERAPKLKMIQKIGVGVNTIDLEAAKARNISVCNMPGTNSRAVAEMTLLLMLAALRKHRVIDQACRSGQWNIDKKTKESLGEVCGRTIAFVGFGEIPKVLAPILVAMGARVIYTANSPKECSYDYFTLDELLPEADILSLHIPLTEETDKLFDDEKFAQMKTGSIFVNTSRGGLVDENALYKCLQSGALGAAGLDVFAEEPVAKDNPLLELDNVVVAPHLAWLTNETFARSIHIAVQNSLAVRDGHPLTFQVL